MQSTAHRCGRRQARRRHELPVPAPPATGLAGHAMEKLNPCHCLRATAGAIDVWSHVEHMPHKCRHCIGQVNASSGFGDAWRHFITVWTVCHLEQQGTGTVPGMSCKERAAQGRQCHKICTNTCASCTMYMAQHASSFAWSSSHLTYRARVWRKANPSGEQVMEPATEARLCYCTRKLCRQAPHWLAPASGSLWTCNCSLLRGLTP
jgi:hypothetical protein